MGLAGPAGVFDSDAHAVMAVVVGEIAEDPDAGMIHFHDGGDALGGAEPQNGNAHGIGHEVSIESDDLERMAGQERGCEFQWRCR